MRLARPPSITSLEADLGARHAFPPASSPSLHSYNDAYFEISSLRIYSDGTDSTSSINVTSTTSNETTTSGTDNGNTNSGNTNGGGNSSGSSDAVGLHKTTGLTAGAVLAALAWAAL